MIVTWVCLCGRRMIVNYTDEVDGWRCRKCHLDYGPSDEPYTVRTIFGELKKIKIFLVDNILKEAPLVKCQIDDARKATLIEKIWYYIARLPFRERITHD